MKQAILNLRLGTFDVISQEILAWEEYPSLTGDEFELLTGRSAYCSVLPNQEYPKERARILTQSELKELKKYLKSLKRIFWFNEREIESLPSSRTVGDALSICPYKDQY